MMSASQAHFYGYIDREVKRYLMTLVVDPTRFHANTR